ncbi:MAG: hypothetical protein KDC26_02435 [Armatimonadetes bacterium]|nr:hypothetical protein [Armatimonadota bacterium]
MKPDKARELFSDYLENSLDAGLKQAFERALQGDPQLNAEYESFASMITSFDTMRDEEIAVPTDLHETISRRLDKHVWDEKQTAKSGGFFKNWRMTLLGSAAVVAIFATVIAFTQNGKDTVREAGTIPGIRKVDSPTTADFGVKDGQVFLSAKSAKPTAVEVTNIENGEQLGEFNVNGTLNSPLSNDSENAKLLQVKFSEESEPLLIVLPGKTQLDAAAGEGSVLELAKAISDTYRTPMIIRLKDRNAMVNWDFTEVGDVTELASYLQGMNLSYSLREDNLVVLSDNN